MYCKLGEQNGPQTTDSLLYPYNAKLKDLPESAKIIYNSKGEMAEGSTDNYQDFKNDIPKSVYQSWLELSKGSGKKGSDHGPTSNALYFFENMQGDKQGQAQFDKTVTASQIDEDGDGLATCITKPDQKGFKNNMRYGTYIEVTAYYVSDNPQNTTKGKIKYRFMLGKNTTYNFNAQRNHHFKVTLGFNGWANQPKWNIEYYEEDPGIYLPDSFEVSYLYNQKHMMPIKIVGNCTGLKMEIVENNWAPYDPNKPDEVPDATIGKGDYQFKWNRAAWNRMYRQKIITPETTQLNNKTWFGFLALAVPVNSGNVPKNIINKQFNDNDDGSGPQSELKTYYETNNGVKSWNTGSQGVRSFTQAHLKYDGPEKGTFYKGYNGWQVTRIDADSKMMLVPLFTRNKSMIIGSGFSGNNPYDSYQRKAVVRVTATFKVKGGGTKTIVSQVPVLQTTRVVNPKGVWRKWNNKNDFTVSLKTIKDVSDIGSDKYFSSFISTGEWRAYVEIKDEANSAFVGLDTYGGSYKKPGVTDTIYGNTGTTIDFKIKFNGVSKNTSSCAVIRVDYNGNQCIHKIMVRQGYAAPLQVVGDAYWSSYTLYSCSDNAATSGTPANPIKCKLTDSPLELGSLFKHHNTKQGILISNNANRGPLVAPDGYEFELTDGTKEVWADIIAKDNNAYEYTSTWGTFTSTVDGKEHTYRLPTYAEFKKLDDAEYGFGVVYADGTDDVQTTFNDAYGYETSADTGKGVRGIMVYNKSNAHQVFFPFGKDGMGRRTQFNVKLTASASNLSKYFGVLRYADVSYVLDAASDDYRPVPYNLPRVPGAIYWLNTTKWHGNDNQWPSAGWDMNYFNYDFNPYPDNNSARMMDARPIKLIVTAGY